MATAPLGELGAAESPPALVEWKLRYTLQAAVPWCIVAAGPLLRRRPAANWAVVVPFVGVQAIWGVARQLVSLPPEAMSAFDAIVVGNAAGLACLWLAADRLVARYGRRGGILLGTVLVAALSFVGAACFDIRSGMELIAIGLTAALLGTVQLSSIAFTRAYRGFRSSGAYLAGLGGRSVLAGVIWGQLVLLGFVTYEGLRRWVLEAVPYAVVFSLIGAAAAFVILLPFLVLAMYMETFRERLRTFLNHPTQPSEPDFELVFPGGRPVEARKPLQG